MIKVKLVFDAQQVRREIIGGWQQSARSFLRTVAEIMRVLMRAPKHGRLFRGHRASAPGEAPAVLTGDLINSIGEPLVRGTVARLTISDFKARLLDPQEGDPVNLYVLPRPFVQPAIQGAVAQAGAGGGISAL